MEYLDKVLEAATEAGKAILDVYTNESYFIEYKQDNSPLTIADKKAHEIIVSFLNETGLPILSEEGEKYSFSERQKWNTFWMIDPLDGTKEFVKRNGEFTVNIALINNGKPIFGVVYAPVLDKLYYGGSTIKSAHLIHNQKEIKLKNNRKSNSKITVVASRSHLNKDTQKFIDQFKEVEIISMGSSLKFMILAEGNANFYPRFAPTMEWDTAAAHAIVDVLGYKVINPETNKTLIYNKECLKNPYFLVK